MKSFLFKVLCLELISMVGLIGCCTRGRPLYVQTKINTWKIKNKVYNGINSDGGRMYLY